MTLSNLLVFALALMVAAGSPGPSVAALVARVLTNGFRDVLPFLAAMWLGEALWLGCAVAGLAVAVPSVMAYNLFVNRLGLFAGELEGFAQEIIGTMAREGRL